MTNSILGFLPAARKTEVEMNPLPASLAVAGFPMTILLSGTTLAAISNTEVLGQVLDEAVTSGKRQNTFSYFSYLFYLPQV